MMLFKMKYSITSGQSKGAPIPLSGSFSRVFSSYNTIYAFCLNQNRSAKLYHFCFEKSQAGQAISTLESSEEFIINEQISWDRLKHITQTEDEWILFLQNPFQIIFCLKKYKTAVTIVLEQQLDVQQMICYVTYPEALLYGYSEQNKNNIMYTVNLQTFQLKQITNAKEYSPAKRSQFWSHFSDGRLYVMGGVDKNGKPADELLWTYNMENGYWFALEVNEPICSRFNCEFENGKVLAIGLDDIYIVQLYQSRVVRLQGWRQVIDAQDLKLVKGVYVFKEEIYLVSQKGVFPTFRVAKYKAS